MPPLGSTGFRRLHRYYGRLRPCAPPRYLRPHGGHPLGFFSLHRSPRFSRSAPEPASGSRRLCAERHPANRQALAGLLPGPTFHPGFDAVCKADDTSSAIHLRSSSRTVPAAIWSRRFLDVHHDGVDRRSSRWFENWPCSPFPRGLPSSLMQLTLGFHRVFS